MKLTVLFLTALLLAPLTALHAADSVKPASKPNVIIVITDDQGYGDLSVTGNPILKTPNMDRLAREGVQFTHFHVDSFCTPTRAALMTGRYSHRVGVWGTINGRNMLRDDEVTMADVFRHNGYRTGLFGKWHLGSNYPYRPIDRGFDEWLGHGDGGTGCTTDYWGNDRVNDHYIHNGRREEKLRPGFEDDVFFDAALQFIRESKGRPFFTYLALYNPHNPCSIPDPKHTEAYQGKNMPGDFFTTIARIDQNLGRLRQCLSEEGLSDNTVLIFLTDNGTAGGDKVFNAGMRGRKGSPYDGGYRVPCFLSWPANGFSMAATVDRLVAHLDLLPTLVDLCALNLPKPVCGEDWFTTKGNCPWNQGAVANGAAAFGYWTVRFAEAGTYQIELRRWPRELETPIAGIPTSTKAVDAWLDGRPVAGTLYKSIARALPASRIELKTAGQVQTADVSHADTVKVFTMELAAGPAEIEATLLDTARKAICSAYYVSIQKK